MDAASILLPLDFDQWPAIAQAAALAVLTFIQEDAPTVGAALLSAAGRLNPVTSFLGCFLGIWIGDVLLYLVARCWGRPLLERPWVARCVTPAAVVRSEQWFHKHGIWLLAACRLIPGTRLPTYLAAGLLRVSFARFALVTGIAAALWVTAIMLLAQTFSRQLAGVIQRWNDIGWIIPVIFFVVLLRASLHLANARTRHRLGDCRQRVSAALSRWRHWEFWPAWLFYAPVIVHYLWLALRYRGFTLPTAANPGIFTGGIVGESKMATLRELFASNPDFTAEAHLLTGALDERKQALQELISARRIVYPFILKPDVGQRGVGVKVIRDSLQADDYLKSTNAPVICQRYIHGPCEIGVFYYRFPGRPLGCIFSITEKIFPQIVGDGVRTVEELVWADPRARLIARRYLDRLGARQMAVLPAGAALKLVEAGNHAQGCIFQDGMHLWSEALQQRIDEISRNLNGFFIGRYDIRYSDQAALRAGRGFQIIELNGAASEATSIYDARNSLWSAYCTLFRQWELVFAIGAINRQLGSSPARLPLIWRAWRQSSALAAGYPMAD
jgi:membrane protein DedA with SNARE-associated domain